MSKTTQEIVDDIVIGWNLGNTLEGDKTEITDDPYFYETSYGQPITIKEMILDVKAAVSIQYIGYISGRACYHGQIMREMQ